MLELHAAFCGTSLSLFIHSSIGDGGRFGSGSQRPYAMFTLQHAVLSAFHLLVVYIAWNPITILSTFICVASKHWEWRQR